MFTDPSSPIGDDLMYPFVHLGARLREMGHRVATLDMDNLEAFDACVFLDYPTALNSYYRKLRHMPGKKMYLLLMENAANRPDNYWKRNHRDFEKVFTWDSRLVDGKKYIKLFLPNKTPSQFSINRAEKTRFCVTIASQKYSGHPSELYSERVRAIRWFEREHPGEFDLYGTGWDRRYFTGPLARLNLGLQIIYKRFPNLGKACKFPSWRGAVSSKNAVMRQYRFAIAYENASFPGYLTEKVFDALFAGCVPIYLGDPEVARSVPPEAFIDKRQFPDYNGLYQYLKEMSDSEYAQRLSAIEEFVRGTKLHPFGSEQLVETILDHIVLPQKK
jgi:hypothetical protein